MKKSNIFMAAAAWLLLVSPAVADSYTDYGIALFNHGDYKNAGRYFAESLRANPNNPKAMLYSAMCCQRLGNAEAAHAGYYTILQVFPNSAEAAQARQALSGAGASTPLPHVVAPVAPVPTSSAKPKPARHAAGKSKAKPAAKPHQ